VRILVSDGLGKVGSKAAQHMRDCAHRVTVTHIRPALYGPQPFGVQAAGAGPGGIAGSTVEDVTHGLRKFG